MKTAFTLVLIFVSYAIAQKTTTPPPPLQVTLIDTNTIRLPNGNYMVTAQVRFSDAMIAAMRKQGSTDADTLRLGLMCGGSHTGCEPLEKGETYWLQYIYPGDAGYSKDYDSGKDECHPARFAQTIGKKAIAVYSVCASQSQDQIHTLTVTGASCEEPFCQAEAYTTRNGRQLNWLFTCRIDNATCMKLKWAHTYDFDVLTQGVDECTPDKRPAPRYECLVIHGRPYDVIYVAVER